MIKRDYSNIHSTRPLDPIGPGTTLEVVRASIGEQRYFDLFWDIKESLKKIDRPIVYIVEGPSSWTFYLSDEYPRDRFELTRESGGYRDSISWLSLKISIGK